MANKLKDIFSDASPEFVSTVKFKDADAYHDFYTALGKVENEGNSVPIEGIDSISLFLQENGVKLPIEHHKNVKDVIVGPVKETFEYTVNVENAEKVYKFQKYVVNSGIVLETANNKLVYLKLLFSTDRPKVNIMYRIQFQYAQSIKDISFELKACINFIQSFYTPTEEMGTQEEIERIDELLRHLRYTEGFVSRVHAVEQKLRLKFSPQKLPGLSNEESQTLEELYLLLCKKMVLRLNGNLTSTDETKIEVNEIKNEPAIGSEISLVFVREEGYDLLEQNFSIYTANVVINAIVKDIQKEKDGSVIFYGDTDSRPMYIAYSAYLSEEQAKNEAGRNIGCDEKYIEALTSYQYIQEYLKKCI